MFFFTRRGEKNIQIAYFCSGQIDVVHCSPLQRALLQSAVALAPRGLRATDVQHVFDHYNMR